MSTSNIAQLICAAINETVEFFSEYYKEVEIQKEENSVVAFIKYQEDIVCPFGFKVFLM